MRRTQELQIRYGILYGVAAVLVGLIASYWIAPEQPNLPSWKTASFVYLNAHGVSVIADRFPQYMLYTPGEVMILDGSTQRAVRILPIALICLASVLVNIGMGSTTTQEYIAKNSLYAAGGYIAAILALLLISNARPALQTSFLIILIAGAALWIGSQFVGKAVGGIPIFGIASLGTLFIVGIFIIAVGWAFVQVMLPVVVVSAVGSALGGGAVYVARTMEW